MQINRKHSRIGSNPYEYISTAVITIDGRILPPIDCHARTKAGAAHDLNELLQKLRDGLIAELGGVK